MRLCAALALVLVALVVLTVKAAWRPRHRAPTTPAADVAEPIAPPPRHVPARAAFRVPRRAPAPVPQAPLPPAAIGGRVHLPVGEGLVSVIVRPSGGDDAGAIGFASEEAFRIEGLLTGRRYDVEFSGSHVRTLKLSGVVAPAADLDVALELPAIIHVAVGFPRGERCPIDTIRVSRREDRAEEQEETFVAEIHNPDCRFALEAPARAGQATVVAEGGGLVMESTVTIPEHGDPEPICLNPPCRANPLEGQARLRLMLLGPDSSSPISATILPVGDANSRYGCGSSIFTCSIESLPAGETFSVTASGRDCHGGPVTVTVVEGDNDVAIPCIRDPPSSETASVPDGDDVDT
jgi:hypothetical protein